MEIIDIHTHTFPDELAPRALAALLEHSPESHCCTDGTVGGLRESMKKNGIARSVLMPIATKPSQVFTINRTCKDLMSDDCIPFGTLHPLYDKIPEEIGYLKSIGVKGIKFHPEYQDFYIDDKNHFPIYDQLSHAGLIVLFHAGKDPGPFTCDHALPDALRRVHENFPELKMVAAHTGGWKVWPEVESVLAGLPVYFDTSATSDYYPPELFLRLIRKHGIERILFGSDSPWFDQGKSRRWIESLPLKTGEIEAILGLNARALLDIK